MKVNFPCRSKVEVYCRICGLVEVCHEYDILADCEYPYPTLPYGWRMIDRWLVCPDHKAKLEIEASGGRTLTDYL